MSVTRVLVCSSDLLLGAIVLSMLAGVVDINVTGITAIADGRLDEAIQIYKPETVIYISPEMENDETKMANYFSRYPDLQFVTVCADDNRVQAYMMREIRLSEVSDLIDIIRSR